MGNLSTKKDKVTHGEHFSQKCMVSVSLPSRDTGFTAIYPLFSHFSVKMERIYSMLLIGVTCNM